MLLIGVGGNGKKSLSLISCALSDCKFISLNLNLKKN